MSFFIIGVGRSGTSLLQSILSSHSDIAIPPETGFVRQSILSWGKNKGLNAEVYTDKNPKLERVKKLFDDNKKKDYLTDIDFYSSFLNRYLNIKKKSVVGDKDPRLVEFIDVVSKLFPDAKFIHLIRDPRDVLLSKKKAAWSKGKPSCYHIFANYIQLKMGEWRGRRLSKGQYISITYEELLGSPKNTLSKVCDFLNIDFEQSMLSFQDKARELVSEEERQWKKETMGPLLKNNSGKWKGRLTDVEVALTELLCKQAFRIGEYNNSGVYSRLSFISKLKVSSLKLLLKVLGAIYMSYRLWSQKLLLAWKY